MNINNLVEIANDRSLTQQQQVVLLRTVADTLIARDGWERTRDQYTMPTQRDNAVMHKDFYHGFINLLEQDAAIRKQCIERPLYLRDGKVDISDTTLDISHFMTGRHITQKLNDMASEIPYRMRDRRMAREGMEM